MAYRNAFATVQAVNHDFPGLIGDGVRYGVFVDQVAHRLNRQDGEVRWGRKARQSGGGNPNGDGLTYLNDPNDRTKKIIVDIILSGPDPGTVNPAAAPSWQEFLGDNLGNGFWTEPVSPPMTGGATPPPTTDLTAILKRLDQLEARSAALEHRMDGAIATGSTIALRTDTGHLLCAQAGGEGTETDPPYSKGEVHTRRTVIGGWEKFTVEKQ